VRFVMTSHRFANLHRCGMCNRPLIFAACILLLATTAQGQGVLLWGDSLATEWPMCNIQARPTATVYLVADVRGTGGITAIEFRATNLPSSYIATSTPTPEASVVTGDPFGDGCRLVFRDCQDGPFVILYRVALEDVGGSGEEARPWMAPPVESVDPYIYCPRSPTMTGCDRVTKVCLVQSGMGLVNGSQTAESAHDPWPEDGAIDVPRDVRFRWSVPSWWPTAYSFCPEVPGEEMYLGINPDPPKVECGDFYPYPYLPLSCTGVLAANTTYYWHVVRFWPGGSAPSPLWSFTTGERVDVAPRTWTNMKRLYR